MLVSKSKLVSGIIALGLTGGLLGGFNMYWGRQPEFPLYGVFIDLCAIPILIVMILYVRRIKANATDEFSVAKKRYAAQNGFLIGFALFMLSGLFPIIFPAAYLQFIATLDGAHEGFLMGRVAGMAPFILGLVIGQVSAWLKYR